MTPNSMNINQIKGRIVTDPEVKETTTGKKFLTFNLMYYTRQTTDKDGSHANFIHVEVWEKLAEVFHSILKKGLEVVINGALVQSRWVDKNQNKKSRFHISAETLAVSDLNFEGQKEAA
ncbi:MAG: single-stranded DNA-binding protein [Spirochaetia bacterium]|nr:single-stranded DNA-binding protein [Spirochaetia bacterium]